MAETLGDLVVRLGLDSNPFNQGISQMNRQIKTSESTLHAFGRSVQGSTDNLDYLRAKSKSLTDTIELQNNKISLYTSSLEKNKGRTEELGEENVILQKKIEGAKNALEQSTASKGEDDRATQNIKKNLDELNYTYSENEEMMRKAGLAYDTNLRSMNRTEGELVGLQAELKNTTDQLKRLESSTYQAGEKLEQWGVSVQGVGSKIKEFSDSLAGAGKKLTVGVTTPILAFGTIATKSAMDFETAFAGVVKTVEMTTAETNEMREAIIAMSERLPHAKESIAEVAEAAGQLGVKKENIIAFTEVMLNLGIATNLSATSAAESMAQFSNITKMSQQDYGRFGSVLVELGNNFATTESDIMSLALRLAGAGAQIGLSEAEIAGFATALSSVGISAEAGGSAFSKVMTTIQKEVELGGSKLEDFAKVAGMSVDEFSEVFKNDAASAIAAFIQGLGDTENAGKSTIVMLDELGLNELRTSDSMSRLAGNSDLVNSAVQSANKAWEENNALTKEAEQFNNTTANQLQVVKNKLNSIAVEIGDDLKPKILDLANQGISWLESKWRSLDDKQKESLVTMAGYAAAAGPVLLAVGKLGGAIGSTVSTVGSLSSGLGGLIKKASESETAMGIFGKVTGAITSPVGIAVAVIGSLAAAAVLLYMHLNKATIAEEEFAAQQERMANASATAAQKISRENEIIAESYNALMESATSSLQEAIDNSTTLTPELVEQLVQSFGTAAEEAKSIIATKNVELVKMMRETYLLDGIISEQEAEMLKTLQEGGSLREAEVERLNERVTEIIEKASAEHRALYVGEQEEILEHIRTINALASIQLTEGETTLLLIQQDIAHGRKELNEETIAEITSAIDQGYEEQLQLADQFRAESLALAREQEKAMLIMADSAAERDQIEKKYRDIYNSIESSYDERYRLAAEFGKDSIDQVFEQNREEFIAMQERTAEFERAEELIRESARGTIASLSGVGEVVNIKRNEMLGKSHYDTLKFFNQITEAQEGYATREQIWLEESVRRNGLSGSQSGLEYTKGLITAFRDGEAQIKEQGQVLGDLALFGTSLALDIQSGISGESYSVGDIFSSSLGRGMIIGKDLVIASAADLAEGALGEAGSYQSAFEQVGDQLGRGIASGLHRAGGGVVAAAAATARLALDTMRETLDVRSPSRKAMEIFGHVGEGAIIGLKNQEQGIEKGAQSFSRAALDHLGGNATISSSGGMVGSSVASIVVNVYFSGDPNNQQDLRRMGKQIGLEIDYESRKRGIFVGG